MWKLSLNIPDYRVHIFSATSDFFMKLYEAVKIILHFFNIKDVHGMQIHSKEKSSAEVIKLSLTRCIVEPHVIFLKQNLSEICQR